MTRTIGEASATVTIRVHATLDSGLSPNARMHWRKRHTLAQSVKHVTMLSVRTAYLDVYPDVPWRLDFTVAWGRNRKRMDDDNVKAALKYVIDGIAAETGVNDRHMEVGQVKQVRDPEGLGWIDVTIRAREVTNEPI